MGNITFEQLPQAVSTLIERVEQLAGKVDEVLGKAAGKDTGKRSLLSLEDVAALLGKSASTIYAMTSESAYRTASVATSSTSSRMKSCSGLNRAEHRARAARRISTDGSKRCAAARNASRALYGRTTNKKPYEDRRFDSRHRTA